MIVSASYRTDLPAFYGEWFQNRFRAGYCRVASPYGGPPARVSLRDGVDGFVFWTRNAAPFLPALTMVKNAGLPFVIQYTVTGYPRALEHAVPDPARSVAVIRDLARAFGPRAVVWRYDPIVLSGPTPPAWHIATFTRLADALKDAVDEVVTSFVEPYAKTARNMDRAATADGFSWHPAEEAEKRDLLIRLAALAGARGLRLSLCTQPSLVDEGLAPAAACIDVGRLADIAGHPVAARRRGNRDGCLCAESRDIGDYDSCPQGCAYCYAVASRDTAKTRLSRHDPDGEYLFAPSARGHRAR